MVRIVDSDQHLYESASLWADFIDPTPRDDYRRMGWVEEDMPGLFHTNVDSLLAR